MLGIESSNFAKVVGAVLRRERRTAGLSQEELGFEAELQRNYISLTELGRYQPTLATVFKLAAALKTPPSRLVSDVAGAQFFSR